jgi:hypothetical protein
MNKKNRVFWICVPREYQTCTLKKKGTYRYVPKAYGTRPRVYLLG